MSLGNLSLPDPLTPAQSVASVTDNDFFFLSFSPLLLLLLDYTLLDAVPLTTHLVSDWLTMLTTAAVVNALPQL